MKIDKYQTPSPSFGTPIEHSTIKNFISHLDSYGFVPLCVKYDESVPTLTHATMLYYAFYHPADKYGYGTLAFRDCYDPSFYDAPSEREFLVPLNGSDRNIISSYLFPSIMLNGADDRWNAAWNSFDMNR